jgi:hypothetical protein
VEVYGVDAPGLERLRKVHEDGALFPFILERDGAEKNLVNFERGVQV